MNGFVDDLKNAFNRPNNGLIQLIAINIIVYVVFGIIYVFSKIAGNTTILDFLISNIYIPSAIQEFIYKPWTLLTYMFAHSITDIFHIIFNMLVFYWFGKLIMEYLGSKKLVSLYFLGGITGGLAYLLMYNTIPYFQELPTGLGMVGASAAVYAVVVAAATLVPEYTFFLLFFGPVKIKYIAAIYIFFSFIGTVGNNAGGNIAHLGGALIGFIFITQLRRGNNIGKPINYVLDGIGGLFKPKSNIKVSYSNVKAAPKAKATVATKNSSNKPNQDEIDAILDKISQAGYDKLTKEEKQKLFKASENK